MKMTKYFQNDLARILQELQREQFSATTTALDILMAYRLLLIRNPEAPSIEAISRRCHEFPNLEELTRAFIASNEFRDWFHGKSVRPDGRIVIVREGNLRVAVSLDDEAIGWQIINGTYEPEIQWLIRKFVRPGYTCLDLGANVGYFTALMADLVVDEGNVYAYEPFPAAFHMLNITVQESRLEKRVSLRQKACTDADTTASLFFPRESNNFGGSFVADSSEAVPRGLESVEISAVRLDTDLEGAAKIDFIKMDVEGAEVKALTGLKNRLASDRPIIITEVNPIGLSRQNSSPEQLLNLLQDMNYSNYLVSPIPGQLHNISSPEIFTAHSYQNIICFPREQAASLISGIENSVT